jgi:predicted DNA-binding protein
MTTTIKVSVEVRDRLKAQAVKAHRTLGEHLAHLADLADRQHRFEALREAIASTPTEVMADYQAEVEAWDRTDRG